MNRLKCTMQSLLIGCLLMGGFAIQAQNVIKPELKWARGLSGSAGKITNAGRIIQIAKGEGESIISAGTFEGTVNFGTDSIVELTAGLLAAYIWKCDDEGNLIWVKKIGLDAFSSRRGVPTFSFTSLSVNEDNGDIYLTGVYADTTIDFDPGPGVQNLIPQIPSTGRFQPSCYVLKLNSQGEFQWVRRIGYGSGLTASSIGKKPGEEHLIYFLGGFRPFINPETGKPFTFLIETPASSDSIISELYSRGYLLCLDEAGDLKWLKTIGEGNNITFSTQAIETDQFDNIYVSGKFIGTVDVNPSPAVYNINGQNDVFLIKYNKSGDLQWARQSEVGTTAYEGVAMPTTIQEIGMQVDDNNGIYLSVDCRGPINFNKMLPYGGPATLINAAYYYSGVSSTTTAMVKYNTSGDFQWVKQIGGMDTLNRAQSSEISVSKDGKIYLTGRYNSQLDLDPDTTDFVISGNDNYIAQYDTAGIFQWGGELTKGVEDGSGAVVNSILAGNNGDVYVCGTWGGSVDFDPSDSTFILTPAGPAAAGFVLKLNISPIDTSTIDPDPEDSTSVIRTPHLDINATIAPNPTSGMLNLIIGESLNDGIVTISNVIGQTVFTRNNLYGKNFNFDLSDFASGTYYLELREGAKRITYKLVRR